MKRIHASAYRKLISLALIVRRRRINKFKRLYWVHPLNLNRDTSGLYEKKVVPLRQYPSRFFQYFRMSVANFDHIHGLIQTRIQKQTTVMRKPISTQLRLAVTLHHLAEGSTHGAIAFHYDLGRSTVSGIIYETCQALWDILHPIYIQSIPSDVQGWKLIANG